MNLRCIDSGLHHTRSTCNVFSRPRVSERPIRLFNPVSVAVALAMCIQGGFRDRVEAHYVASAIGIATLGQSSTSTPPGFICAKDPAFATGTPDNQPAKGDGTHDDTYAIQNAINALGTAGGVLFFPPGQYVVQNSTNPTFTLGAPITIMGSGPAATVFLCNHPTADMFVAYAPNVPQGVLPSIRISQVGFDVKAGVARTGGAFVNFRTESNGSTLDHFAMNKPFVGVRMATGATLHVEYGVINNAGALVPGGGNGSAAILVTYDVDQLNHSKPANDHYIRCITTASYTSVLPSAGIWVQNTGALNIIDCDITRSNNDLYITGGASIYVMNSYFDSAGNGIYISATTDNIARVHFIGCWSSNHINRGVFIDPNANFAVDTITFAEHHALINGQNTAGDGMYLGKGNNIRIANSDIYNNGGSGISVATAVQHYQITGNRIGVTSVGIPQGAQTLGNQYGIFVSGSDYYVIENNDITGNQHSPGIFYISPGTHSIVGNNFQ